MVKLSACLRICVAIALLLGQTQAKELQFTHAPQTLKKIPISLYSPHFPDGKEAWESWAYTFVFPKSNTILTSLFSVSNIGPGEASGLAFGLIIPEKEKAAALRNSRKKKEWTYASSPSGLKLQIARHSLEINPPSHNIHMLHGDGEFWIESTATIPPLRPGPLEFSKNKTYDLTILAPRLNAKGKYRLEGHPTIDLGEGFGIAIHSYSSFAEHDQAISWMRLDTFDQDIQLSLLEFTTPKNLKYQRISLLILMEKGQILKTVYGYERTYEGFEADPKKNKYRTPRKLHFKSLEGPVQIEGAVTLKPVYRVDFLEWVSSGVVRFLARQVAHPIDYKMKASYEFKLKREVAAQPEIIKGQGFASFVLLNEPPKDL